MTRPTREQILQATPDQLNQWTAEHVMGWISVNGWSGELWQERRENGWRYWFCGSDEDRPEPLLDEDWFPSLNWNAAMRVRDKVMSELHLAVDFTCALEKCVALSLQICHSSGGDILFIKHLQPQHICQAALLAVCEVDETNKETP